MEHLHLQVAFVFDAHLLTYRIRLVALADSASLQQSSYFWSTDELQTMETFFSDQLFPALRKSRAVESLSFLTVQSLNIAMSTFARMLMFIPPRVLKDLVRIIQLEQVCLAVHLLCIDAPLSRGRILKVIISGEHAGVWQHRRRQTWE